MKYFSMFSGIGGFELGIANATNGLWECVGFSEIDKHAINTYTSHFPNHKNFGDATKINPDELPDFDFLCGGFPCQAFSIAGKRKGFSDTRGTLFFEIARILKIKRPKIILLENVKGLLNHNKGETFSVIMETLDELGYETQWMVLNSKFFGVPQNRERVFITGNLRDGSKRKILSFREDDKEFNGEERRISGEIQTAQCLTSRYYKMGATDNYINYAIKDKRQHSRVYEVDGICPTLAGASKLSGDCTPKIIPVLTPLRSDKRQNGRRFKDDGEEMFTLTGQDQHGIMIQSHSPRCGDPSKGGTGLLESSEHCFTLDSTPHYVNKIRRLTPIECERLQGFPDGWTLGSDTQRYKQCGNAVTTKVIEAVVKRINENMLSSEECKNS